MVSEALFAVAGIGVTVWASLPEERRLDIRLRFHWVDWLVLGTAVVLVHCILFSPVFAAWGFPPYFGRWRWGFTPATASYLTLLLATLTVIARLILVPLPRSNVLKFRKWLETLFHQRRYADLIFLLDRHLQTLCRAYKNDYWLPRLHDRLVPSNWVILTQPNRSPSPVVRKLARLLPEYHRSRDSAREAVRRLLLPDEFVRQLAKIQPNLGLRMLDQQLAEGSDFQTLWIAALLDDTTSVLYYEVTNAVTSGDLDDGSRILHFYLDDVQRARALLLNKALSDYVAAELDRLHLPSATDRYNQSFADFDKGPRITDPVYAALLVFQLMVSAAIHQNVAWPIPLYHFTHFTDLITRNLAPDPRVDLTKEWPTPYHFFLDRMVSWLCEWIESAANQSEDEANAALRLDDLRYGNGDIPKNAVLALGTVTKTIMTAGSVDEHFKIRVLKSILELEGNQYGTPPRHPFGDLVLESIVAGGDDAQGRSDNVASLRHIIELGRGDLQHTRAVARLKRILACE